MVENLIAGYLASGKRLVIPELGAFLKKETGETVFVEFLKKDDGELSGLVARSMGFSAMEAASVVSQFSADIKTALGARGFYIVPNVGTLRRDNAGHIILSVNSTDAAGEPAQPFVQVQEPAPKPVVAPGSQAAAAQKRAAATQTTEVIPQAPKPVQPAPEVRPGVAPPAQQPVQKQSVADTPPVQRSKPVIENYTPGKPGHTHSAPPRPKPAAAPARKKTDLIMIIAIAAALIAIGSMIFGLLVERNPVNSIQPTQQRIIDTPVNDDVTVVPAEEQ